MTRYQLSPAADADMDEIWEHVAMDAGETIADHLDAELHAAMHRLAEHPGIGHLRPDIASFRVYVVHRYLIVYDAATRPIQIVRVVHGARDLAALFLSNRPHDG